MPTKTLDFLQQGTKGLYLDTPPYALEPTAFTRLLNCRLAESQLRNFPGHVRVCEGGLTVDNPYYLQGLPTDDTYYWILSGLTDAAATDICITDGSTKRDVSPAESFLITANDQWSGGVFNGVSVLNNGGTNPPLYLTDPVAGQYEDLPFSYSAPGVVDKTWRDQSMTARVVRPFKNFLIALDITKSNARYPYMLKWSDAADPGFIPAWDETDPTLLAGEYPLAETGGFLIDFVPLGDLGMVYKEDSVWSMSLVGGQYVFNFRKAISTIGALAPNCIAEFMGQHIVLGYGDIVVHNGATTQSVVDKRIKNYIFRVMDTDYYKSSFIARNDQASEIWVCIPTIGHTLPDIAAVWNWRDDTWTLRDLPAQTSFLAGVVDITQQNLPTTEPWGCLGDEAGAEHPCDPNDPSTDVEPIAWGSDTVPYVPKIWTERDFNPVVRTFVSVGESGIFKMDEGLLYGDIPGECRAERRGIPLAGNDRQCKVRRVYPLMESSGPVRLSIGAQQSPSAPVDWEALQTFLPGVDSFINVRSTGKLHAWRIETNTAVEWSLYGFRMDYTEEGRQ